MGLSEEVREETSTSATLDTVELDALYRDLPSYQPESVGDLATAEETRVVLPPTLSTEQIASRLESAGEMTVASTMPLVLATTGLRLITSPVSLTLIVKLAFSGVVTSATSLMASVLVSMKTPPRFPAIPHPSQTIASATSFTVVTVKPVEGLSLGITLSPRVIEAEKEFVTEMVDNFYKSLKRFFALILKGSTTSFAALKVVLSRNIKSIQDFRGDGQAISLELLVENFERDVGEWRHLSISDLTPLIDEELKRLAA